MTSPTRNTGLGSPFLTPSEVDSPSQADRGTNNDPTVSRIRTIFRRKTSKSLGAAPVDSSRTPPTIPPRMYSDRFRAPSGEVSPEAASGEEGRWHTPTLTPPPPSEAPPNRPTDTKPSAASSAVAKEEEASAPRSLVKRGVPFDFTQREIEKIPGHPGAFGWISLLTLGGYTAHELQEHVLFLKASSVNASCRVANYMRTFMLREPRVETALRCITLPKGAYGALVAYAQGPAHQVRNTPLLVFIRDETWEPTEGSGFFFPDLEIQVGKVSYRLRGVMVLNRYSFDTYTTYFLQPNGEVFSYCSTDKHAEPQLQPNISFKPGRVTSEDKLINSVCARGELFIYEQQ